jgi:hypothetical protein
MPTELLVIKIMGVLKKVCTIWSGVFLFMEFYRKIGYEPNGEQGSPC